VAQSYCTHCGAELGDEARLCPSCGRAVHETAAVSTPETDVSVPPVSQASEDTSGHAARTEEEHRPRISLGKFLGGFLVLVVVLWLLIPTEDGSDGV
jgi:predicted amidophosphoribosyltransferase